MSGSVTPSGVRGLPADVDTVVAFGAHPDDVDFGAAGTLAALADAGAAITYVVMTAGDAGGFRDEDRGGIEGTRAAEQAAAGAVVGIREVIGWDEKDGALAPSAALERDVVRVLRRLRPQLVLCPHPERDYARLQRSHPDHLACGEIVTRAVYPALENPYAYPELLQEGLDAFRLHRLWYYGAPAERENHLVDVGPTLHRKIDAIMAHTSQHPDPERTRTVVTAQLARLAARAGWGEDRHAEAFHAVQVNGADTIAGF